MRNINKSIAKTKHGDRSTYNGTTKEYGTWQRMKARCFNQKNPKYPIYGGRGITVCSRWVESYKNFLEDMGRAPSAKHSLDRKDVNGHYEPLNCRWATTKEQSNNVRRNILIEYLGQSKTLGQWCDHFNLKYHLVYGRIRKGWTPELAFDPTKRR